MCYYEPSEEKDLVQKKLMNDSIVRILALELVAWDLVAMPIIMTLISLCECGSKFFRKLALPVPCC